MAALRTSQLCRVLSKWSYQKPFLRLPNYSSAPIPDGSTSSPKKAKNGKKTPRIKIDVNNVLKLEDLKPCCDEGCLNCVWLEYTVNIAFHFKNDKAKLQEALESIPDADRRAFVEFELKRHLNELNR